MYVAHNKKNITLHAMLVKTYDMTAELGKILTMDSLKKCGIIIAYWCYQ